MASKLMEVLDKKTLETVAWYQLVNPESGTFNLYDKDASTLILRNGSGLQLYNALENHCPSWCVR